MLRHAFFVSSVTIAILGLLVSQWTPPTAPRTQTIRQGRNNTVLFLANSEHGLSNVHVATAYALLEQHPEVEVHYASFPSMGRKLDRVSRRAQQINPSARSIVYHELPEELRVTSTAIRSGRSPANLVHAPGLASIKTVTTMMPWIISVWPGEEHMALFEKTAEVIEEVDPSLIVLEAFLRPSIHAAWNSSRLHAMLSPLTPIDHFPLYQPYGSWLWKYPVIGSGISFPVPWTRFLENMYINVRYFYASLRMANYRDTQKYLESKGLSYPVHWFNLHNPDVPWVFQALPDASIPVDVIPPNVTLAGPIILSLSSAQEEAPELSKWLSRAPTVLVSLGTLFTWTETQAVAMAQALAEILSWRSDIQVLWKFMRDVDLSGTPTYDDSFLDPLRPYLDSQRLRMESWLEVQPVTILETGHIVLSVHHGGAGCYHEALGGLGVWGCPKASPLWNAACLANAFRTILSNDAYDKVKQKASRFSEMVKSNPGQYVAAREIARLATSGYAA
ncbi:hypothetical protein F5Y08DRAFT_333939 [Xylaria arbuscula]|nr:hypothetical protein F5Y08DRAFT_333939 [Xylaria arbuscula]